MKKLSDILPTTVKRFEVDSNATAAQVIEVAEQYLINIFGTENIGKDKKIFGKKLQQGLLFFEVSSSGWNNRLFMEKTGLLEYLQEKFPRIPFTDIRGRVQGE